MLGPEQGGLGRYAEQLVNHLMEIDQDNQYVLLLCKENWDLVIFDEQKLMARDHWKKVLADFPWYSASEQIKLGKIIKKENIDLMHFPHWNVPFFYNCPFVVTIHDLIMFHYPRREASALGPAAYWLKDKASRIVLHHATKASKHIIVTSEFVKRDVHNTLGIPLEKMTVTHQAPFSIHHKRYHGSNKEQIFKKYGINKPYVLYVGVAFPHKNLAGLLRAWKIFEEKYSKDYQLVFAGKENYFYQKLKSDQIIEQLANKPIFTNFVDDDELRVLYENSYLYIFPSLSEGFGLPPLEAMSYGVPVISSNRTCLPEILGDAALYFDPENYEQMAECMYRALTDKDVLIELQQNARGQVKLFSWRKLARQTIEIYSRYKV